MWRSLRGDHPRIIADLGWRIAAERAMWPPPSSTPSGRHSTNWHCRPAGSICCVRRRPSFWTNTGIDITSPGGGMTTLSQGWQSYFLDDSSPARQRRMMASPASRLSHGRRIRCQRSLPGLSGNSQGEGRHWIDGRARTWFGKPLRQLGDLNFSAWSQCLAPDGLKPAAATPAQRSRPSHRRLLAAVRTNACGTSGWQVAPRFGLLFSDGILSPRGMPTLFNKGERK